MLAAVALALTWGRDLAPAAVVVAACFLAGAVLVAVHHAEVVAHRVGEPFGSLILAVAVTVIEVALIVTLMASGGPKTASLARDTVFAAVMITCNGIVGLSLLVATLRRRVAVFNAEGTGAALATVATLATFSLVLPSFTTSTPGPVFTTGQLAFAAVASLALYGLFVLVQTVRHRDYFLPVESGGAAVTAEHAEPPRPAPPWPASGCWSSPWSASWGWPRPVPGDRVRRRRRRAPAVRGGRRDRPAGAAAGDPRRGARRPAPAGADQPEPRAGLGHGQHRPDHPRDRGGLGLARGPLLLGLGATQLVLLALTVVTGILTVVPGRATLLQAGVHLALMAGFVVLAISP